MFSTKEVKKHLQIPLKEILLATDGFAEENRIAKGGFGNVYKGVSEEHGQIAVKRWDRKLGQGDHEFRIEIAFHSEYKHENIASFVGFCDEDDEKILVYEYESNGSLDKHLDNKNLTWVQRVQICIGVAKGLEYCHNDIAPHHRVLHRDVKSSNILLDENLKAKVSDFGLSKITPANVSCTFLMSAFCGTFGYIDPDYFITGYLTQKSDVYSLGIVLFEVLCGRLTHVTSYKDERQFLKVLVQEHYKKGTLHKIVHPELRNQIKPASLLTFTNIAYQCLKNVNDRPLMNQVVKQLQKALDDQLAPDGTTVMG